MEGTDTWKSEAVAEGSGKERDSQGLQALKDRSRKQGAHQNNEETNGWLRCVCVRGCYMGAGQHSGTLEGIGNGMATKGN
jgi:hypothetical protein